MTKESSWVSFDNSWISSMKVVLIGPALVWLILFRFICRCSITSSLLNLLLQQVRRIDESKSYKYVKDATGLMRELCCSACCCGAWSFRASASGSKTKLVRDRAVKRLPWFCECGREGTAEPGEAAFSRRKPSARW